MAMPIYSLSPWERVGVRAYRCLTQLIVFVFECHSPTRSTNRRNGFLSQSLIPSPSPKGRRETIRANDFA